MLDNWLTPSNGLRIMESNYLGKHEAIETERSIKRRAKKRWVKRKYRLVWIEDTNIYHTPEGFICSPSIARQLRAELQEAPHAR